MMDKSQICRKCGKDVWEISEHGRYLKRVSPKGGDFIGECSPSCEHEGGGNDEAVLRAIGIEPEAGE